MADDSFPRPNYLKGTTGVVKDREQMLAYMRGAEDGVNAIMDAHPSLPCIEMGAMFVYRGRVLKVDNILPHSDGCDVTLKVAE